MCPHENSVIPLRKTDDARVLLKIRSKLVLMTLRCVRNLSFHPRDSGPVRWYRERTLLVERYHCIPNLIWSYLFIYRRLPLKRIVQCRWRRRFDSPIFKDVDRTLAAVLKQSIGNPYLRILFIHTD